MLAIVRTVSVLVSAAPWLALSLLITAKPETLEGVLFALAYIGAASFVLTSPLVAISYATWTKGEDGRVRGKLPALTYCLISLPTVMFQGIIFAASISSLIFGLSVHSIHSFGMHLAVNLACAILLYATEYVLYVWLSGLGRTALLFGCAVVVTSLTVYIRMHWL